MTGLERVRWIGGGTGAGKTTVAKAIAERHGLERYDYDWHDARDHSDRTRVDRHPNRAAFLAMSMDERWVLRSPARMAEMEVLEFRERFGMVLQKGNKLVGCINHALNQLKADGTLSQIQDKWLAKVGGAPILH